MPSRTAALHIALVVGAALAAFATALHGSFVNWDDPWLLLENPYVRALRHLPTILDPTADRTLLGAEYLPLRDLNSVVDFLLFGLEPTGYRLGNWLLHGLASALAYAFLREALGSPRAALAGALLWAVHPLHAEVVAWASARKDLLNAVFALLAATLHLRSGRTGSRGLRWAAAGAFVLATLSKSAAAALPMLLAAWEAHTGDPAVPFRRRAAAALGRAAPLLAVALAGAAINAGHQGQDWIRAEWRGGGRLANLAVMAGVHLRYVRQLLFPTGLAADYDVGEDAPWAAGHVAGLALLVAALAGTALLLRRRPREGLAALWWFLLLLPASNLLFPITNASADRYLHLPSLGPCALAGILLDRVRAGGPSAARAATAGLAAAVVLLGAGAAAQARTWRDDLTLWTRALRVSPGCGRVWMNYGEALLNARRREEALDAFRRMIEVEPDQVSFRVHAGNRIAEHGGNDGPAEAERILRDAVAMAAPGTAGPHVALAWLLNATGRRAESVALLEEAVRRQPGLAPARFNLGQWHLSEGRTERGAEELEEALRLGLPLPDAIVAHQRLFEVYDARGDVDLARKHREERERMRALLRGE